MLRRRRKQPRPRDQDQKRKNKELAGELTPRGLVAWARKYQEKAANDGKDTLALLKAAAKVTWMPYVAGTDADGYVRDDGVSVIPIGAFGTLTDPS